MADLIDNLYDDPDALGDAIRCFHWENAEVKSVFVGYEDHGLLTVSIIFQGEYWSQGFGCRHLGSGDAFKNYIEGWLTIAPVHGAEGKPVRIARETGLFTSPLVAVRPLIKADPIFWPGSEDRFYAFDSFGNVLKQQSKGL